MNVIFLTVSRVRDLTTRSIYSDLMRKFRDEGHNVYIVTPYERQFHLSTSLNVVDGVNILGVRTLNIQKTNVLEKGIGTILLETQYKRAIKRYLSSISFDLILYSTPPITFNEVISFLKSRNPKAISYLLLKDIFPQNAVDLGMFSKSGILYKYFRSKEVQLYKQSDFIGCMSPANVNFVLEHNAFLDKNNIEVSPNSIEIIESKEPIDKTLIRKKYNLPVDKPIFIYGGNLGQPQGIPFLIECLEKNKDREDCHFIVVGNGTKYKILKDWYDSEQPKNISVFARLPKEDYDKLVQSCDVGLIFLDYKFTIPNFPSRLLSYLEYKMPIIAATDINTDVGTIAEENKFGFWCESVDSNKFTECVDCYIKTPKLVKEMGQRGFDFLLANYQVEHTYSIIISHIK